MPKHSLLVLAVALGVHGGVGLAVADADEQNKTGAAAPMSEKAACAQTFVQAQRFQMDMKYLEANREFLKCAVPTCGEIVFRECSKMYSELQEAIPTVVFSARDAQSNNESTAVAISVDGVEILQRIDGRPMPIDPGSHHFKFTIEGRDPVEQDLVVRAGDKFRQISVVFQAPRSEQPAATLAASRAGNPLAPSPVEKPSAPPADSGRHSIPIGSYVLGGLGVAALGVFGALRLVGSNDYDDLDRSCTPNCSQSSIDKVRREYLISNIMVGVGGAALAGAVIVYIAAPSTPHRTAFGLTPTSGGVSARLLTHF